MTNPNANVGPGPQPGVGGALGSDIGDGDAMAGIDGTYLTDIGGTSPPPMKTLVYQPDVRILIAHDNKQYDVSADIVACSVARVENAASTVVFKLANKPDSSNKDGIGRYTPLFAPMDRIVVFMKRIEWIQVFSGFLDRVPLVNLYNQTVDFKASCTIKKIIHTWWDPGLPASSQIFDQFSGSVNEQDGQEKQLDSGLGSVLRRLLIQVGNWDSKNIHIQRFPLGYYNFMKEQINRYNGTDQAVEKFRRMLLGDDTSGGVGPAAGRQLAVNKGGYNLSAPERKLEVIRAVDEFGMGIDTRNLGLGQGVGVAAQGGKDEKDQPGWNAFEEIGRNYTEAAQKNDAAIHCFMTIAVESNWIMYANNSDPATLSYPHEAISTDHTSSGLYQQQKWWGTADQRMNVRESTGMFLNALQGVEWRNMDRGNACQAVQKSGAGYKYALQEQAAIEEVRALRTGSGTAQGSAGQSSTPTGMPTLGAGAVGTPPPPITAGVPGGGGVPAIPTTNGTPSPASATEALGQPKFDTAKAISYGLSRLGTPYVWAAPGPDTFDCSSFTQWCYRAMGMEIGRDTFAQASTMQHISMAQAQPGDLLEPADQGHVVIWLGNGSILHAPHSGDVVKVSPLYFKPAYVLHAAGAEYGGVYPVPFDVPTGPAGAAPGTVAPGPNGSTATVGSNEPIARNLFSYQFEPGRFVSYTSSLFGGGDENSGSPPEAAFINDEPLIQSVVAVCKAGLRNFQSLPNGDFAAYYPDYFGLDGKDAVLDLEDIEMKDVKIDWNDDALATHVYVAGTMNPRGASMGIMGWLNTKGIATVENEWLFRRMTAAAPRVKGAELKNGKEIMRRFGVRPLTQDMSAIQSGAMEFLMALQIFMTKWAEQYSTNVEFAFMPELYPGMRINLVGHNLQVYVSGVTHSGDFENGFTTTATIMAPSTPAISRIRNQLASEFKGGWDERDIDGNQSQWFFSG